MSRKERATPAEEKIEQLREKSAQAYQVIGYLDALVAGDLDIKNPSDDEWVRALDYFCDPDGYDEDFLPWPRAADFPQQRAGR